MKDFIYNLKYRLLGFLLLTGVIKYHNFNTRVDSIKDRPLHFLLAMTYSALKIQGFEGICVTTFHLWQLDLLSISEHMHLKQGLDKNKPKDTNKFSKYLEGPFWTGKSYWWYVVSTHPGALKPRLQFLKDLIKHVR